MQRRKGRTNTRVQRTRAPGRGRGRGGGGAPRTKKPFAVTSRTLRIGLHAEYNVVLNGATALNPFGYSYILLTNPQLSNAGSATPVPFFMMYAAGYRKFRVNSYRVRCRYGNAENFFINAFVCPFNYLPPNTVASNTAAYENPRTKKALISPKGGMDKGVVQTGSTVQGMGGFSNRLTEDNFVGNVDGSSPPTDNVYMLISMSTNGAISVSGVFVSVEIDFSVDFFECQTPATLSRTTRMSRLWHIKDALFQLFSDVEAKLRTAEPKEAIDLQEHYNAVVRVRSDVELLLREILGYEAASVSFLPDERLQLNAAPTLDAIADRWKLAI